MFFLPALAAGAVSAGISFFGGKSKQKEEKRARAEAAAVQARNEQRLNEANAASAEMGERYLAMPEVNLKGMVEQAEAAGFNPMTVMRNGGMGLFSKQVQLPGMSMMLPQNTFQESPLPQVRSTGSVMAGAASDGFSTFMSQHNILQQQDFQRTMLDATLKGVQAGKKAGKGAKSFEVPSIVSYGGATAKQGAGVLAYNLPYPSGWGQKTETGKKELVNPWHGRRVDPTTPNATTITERYGESELVEMIAGTKVAFDDLWTNVTGKTGDERYRDYWLPTKGALTSAADTAASWWGAAVKVTQQPALSSSWVPAISWR